MFAGQGMIAQSCLGAFIGTLEVGGEGRVRVFSHAEVLEICKTSRIWRADASGMNAFASPSREGGR